MTATRSTILLLCGSGSKPESASSGTTRSGSTLSLACWGSSARAREPNPGGRPLRVASCGLRTVLEHLKRLEELHAVIC
jgi:hypothetical protein